MEFLSDDPTYPAVILGVAALVCLVLLKLTQQGRYLIYAGGTLALLAALMLAEWLWITEDERIEATVYGLARAVAASDPERAAEFLAPECRLEPIPDRGNILIRIISNQFSGPVDRERLRETLPNYAFDYLRVTRLRTHAGRASGMGTAEFVIHTLGLRQAPSPAGFGTPPAGMGWSFGLREVEPHVWKVARITPGRLGDG